MKYITSLFLVLLFNAFCYAEPLILPEELIKGAKKLGYEQVSNYYENRPGMVDPCYVYGCLSGERELSAVFWCKKKGTQKEYALILMKKRNFLEKGKFNVIYKTRNYPRGLSIHKGEKIDLTYFHYIDDLDRTGAGEVLESGILTYNTYDGVGSVFCFNNGKWMITQYD